VDSKTVLAVTPDTTAALIATAVGARVVPPVVAAVSEAMVRMTTVGAVPAPVGPAVRTVVAMDVSNVTLARAQVESLARAVEDGARETSVASR